jgi:hypothetical protein
MKWSMLEKELEAWKTSFKYELGAIVSVQRQ